MSEFGRIFTPEKEWLGIDWSMGDKKEKAARAATKENEAKEIENKKKAEATVLAEQKAEEEKASRRALISSQSTSGFGANTNLARSFLTSL